MVEALLLLACAGAEISDSKAGVPDSGADSDTEIDSAETTDSHSGDTGDTPDSADTDESGDSDDATLDTCAPDADASAPVELLLEEVAAAKILGETPYEGGMGYLDTLRVAAAGDVDGDGQQDLVAGCTLCNVGESFGKAWLMLGPFGGTSAVTGGRAEFYNAETSDLGYTVASAGDTTGDGTDDLLLSEKFYEGEPDLSGRVLLVTEPPSGSVVGVAAATASFVSEYLDMSGSGLGDGLGAGNFDGDEHRDIFLTAPTYAISGAVFVVSGPFAGEYFLPTDSSFVFHDTAVGAAANLHDHDGDGIDDIGIGASSSDRKSVFVFNGPLDGTVGIADADSVLLAHADETAAAGAGQLASAGDVNADGYPDAIVGSTYLPDQWGEETGGAYVVTGPFAPTADLADSQAILLNSGDRLSLLVDGPGDLDGDGWDDVVVGTPEWDYFDPQPGRVFVTMGPVCGTIDLVTEATYTLIGSDFANAGEVVDHADFDADGHPDLLITGPEDTEGGGYAGAAWIVSGFDER